MKTIEVNMLSVDLDLAEILELLVGVKLTFSIKENSSERLVMEFEDDLGALFYYRELIRKNVLKQVTSIINDVKENYMEVDQIHKIESKIREAFKYNYLMSKRDFELMKRIGFVLY